METQPVQSPAQIASTSPRPSTPRLFNLLLVLLALALVAVSAFLYFENQNLKKQYIRELASTSISPEIPSISPTMTPAPLSFVNDGKFSHPEYPFEFTLPPDWDVLARQDSKINELMIDDASGISYAKEYGCENATTLCQIWGSMYIMMSDASVEEPPDPRYVRETREELEIAGYPATKSIQTNLVDTPGSGPVGTKSIHVTINYKGKIISILLVKIHDEEQQRDQVNAFNQILSTFEFRE